MSYFNNDESISRQIILDHYDSPTHKIFDEENKLKNYLSYNNKSDSCIDNLTLFLKIENNVIVDIKFSGIGCAISTASTDIFCEMIINKDLSFANDLIAEYLKMVEGNEYDEDKLKKLLVFKNISKQLNRIKCSKVGVMAIKEIIANINYDR